MKGQRIPYSDVELAFIEANAFMPRRALLDAFVREFGRADVTIESRALLEAEFSRALVRARQRPADAARDLFGLRVRLPAVAPSVPRAERLDAPPQWRAWPRLRPGAGAACSSFAMAMIVGFNSAAAREGRASSSPGPCSARSASSSSRD